MRMDRGVFVVVLGLLVYVRSGTSPGLNDALAGSPTVWVKDVTSISHKNKRIFDDPFLPHQLTFHIKKGSHDLTLMLKRNYEIDPNANIYVVQISKDGLSIPIKTKTLEKEAVAYYQDKDHGAYMTVRCVKSLNQQCDRVILMITGRYLHAPHSQYLSYSLLALWTIQNYSDIVGHSEYNNVLIIIKFYRVLIKSGNIQIGDTSYHLIPAGTDARPENLFDASHIIGRRYVLVDQTHIQEQFFFENRDTSKVHNTKAQEELKVPSRLFTRKEKVNCFYEADVIYQYQNLADLKERWTLDETRQLRQNYYVKVALLIDSGIWDSYYSKVDYIYTLNKIEEVKRRIKEAYSHIMNGVNLRYQSITDPSVSIHIILTDFILFLQEDHFPHISSKVTIENGKTYIEATSYIDDLSYWDQVIGATNLRKFDHAMLFTMHELYKGSTNNCTINVEMFDTNYGIVSRSDIGFSLYTFLGRACTVCELKCISVFSKVCVIGYRLSLIQTRDYVRTVGTATHELGHNLGAFHDGEGEAVACKSEDFFIMSAREPKHRNDRPYIQNMWTFSNCSVESFKKTLKKKQCVKNAGSVYDINEYKVFMEKEPGDIFTPNEHCSLLFGPGFVNYMTEPEEICDILRCQNPATGETKRKHIFAARGTECGENKWCFKGRCVFRNSK